MRSCWNITNKVLLAVFVLSLAANWFCGRDYAKPNIIIFGNMVNSVPYDAQSENGNFKNGITFQNHPEGSIPRGTKPLHYEASEDDAKRVGEELLNPHTLEDAAAVDRGSIAYGNYCLSCHGSNGAGDGPVAKRGFPPPPSLNTDSAKSMKDGQIFHIITYGKGNMPAHAAQILPEDRWKIILHLRQMQRRAR